LLTLFSPKNHHVTNKFNFPGFDLSTEAGFEEMMSDFDQIVGFKYLKAMHLNDSKGTVPIFTMKLILKPVSKPFSYQEFVSRSYLEN
jgi:hypothetical protein